MATTASVPAESRRRPGAARRLARSALFGVPLTLFLAACACAAVDRLARRAVVADWNGADERRSERSFTCVRLNRNRLEWGVTRWAYRNRAEFEANPPGHTMFFDQPSSPVRGRWGFAYGTDIDTTPWRTRYMWGAAAPYWVLMVPLLAVYPWYFLGKWAAQTRIVRRRRGLCPACGYDLRAGTSDRCPECGEPVRRDAVRVT